jgi:hypothetical protein
LAWHGEEKSTLSAFRKHTVNNSLLRLRTGDSRILQKDRKMNNHTQSVLNDPSVSYFTKNIIREGLEKDPVDAVAYVELALAILKEELLSKLY